MGDVCSTGSLKSILERCMLLVFELYRRCKCVFHDNLAVVCACVCVFDAPIVVNIYIYISINDACTHEILHYSSRTCHVCVFCFGIVSE